VFAAVRDDLRVDGDRRWRTRFVRTRLAVTQAAAPRSEHELALERRGYASSGRRP
jgi:hypothetical protein